MITARGKVKGNTVVLDDNLECYDGSDAVVVIAPAKKVRLGDGIPLSEKYTREEIIQMMRESGL